MQALGWEVGKTYKVWAGIDKVVGFKYHAFWGVQIVVEEQDGQFKGNIRMHSTPRSKRDIEIN